MEQLTLFENQQKSTDWKWWFKDYPAKKNGLKVFSFFSGGGGVAQWDINSPGVMC